jgi:hypothetical protein
MVSGGANGAMGAVVWDYTILGKSPNLPGVILKGVGMALIKTAVPPMMDVAICGTRGIQARFGG